MAATTATAPPIPRSAAGTSVPATLAARLLGTHPGRVRQLAAGGRIRSRRIGDSAPTYDLYDVLVIASAAESDGQSGPSAA